MCNLHVSQAIPFSDRGEMCIFSYSKIMKFLQTFHLNSKITEGEPLTIISMYVCRAFLNVCFAYTSRQEMTEAVRRLAQGAADGMILPG